jgi:toxin FitB
VHALPAHVAVEAYAVLTSLPAGFDVPPAVAADVLTRRFEHAPLRLGAKERLAALTNLGAAGIVGNATHDGLVALEALGADASIATLDRRAMRTYKALGVTAKLIA